MNILITGINGFIGRNLSSYLNNKKYNILGLSRNRESLNKQVIFGDLNDLYKIKNSIINFKPDVVIHLAWQEIDKLNLENSKKNYLITKNFFSIIFKNTSCKKIIITGSCLEYDITDNLKSDEYSKLNRNLSFSIYKNKILKLVHKKCKEKKIKYYWLRLFYVYGKFQKRRSLIPMIISQIKKNKKIEFKNPLNENDFVPVEKVSKTIEIIINEKIPKGIYNVGSGDLLSVKEIFLLLAKKLNYKKIKEIISIYKEDKKSIKNIYSNNDKYNKYFKIKLRSNKYYINKMINYF